MSMQQILDHVRSLDGIHELAPEVGSPFPELAWGDRFFYVAPDGVTPTNRQPFATIVTKDYPDDASSRLGGGRWRLNIHVGRDHVARLGDGAHDPAEADALVPHPVYGPMGWVSVVLPGERTLATVRELLTRAHADDRARVERRG